jgi:large subunit ribosomal protein L28
MSRTCQVTGAGPGFGNNRPWSKKATRRRWEVNLQKKTYYVPSLGRKVTLRLSTNAIKRIDVRGIDAVVAEMRARGEKV